MLSKFIPILIVAALFGAIASIGSTATAQRQALAPQRDPQQELRGAWTLQSYLVNGKQTRGQDGKSALTFEGNRWTATWPKDSGIQIESGVFKLVAADQPMVLDLVHEAGPYKGTTSRALIQVAGDCLTYVQVLFPGPTPGAAASTEATSLTTVHATYRRQVNDSKPAIATLSNWNTARSYDFNGIDEFVSVPDHEALRLSAFTISAWVRTQDTSLMQPIVGKTEGAGNQMSYLLRIQDGGKVSLVLGNGVDKREAHWRTKGVLTSGKWHHVAATWCNERGDQTDATIYIDGVAQETEMNLIANYGLGFRPGYSAEPLLIGRDQFPSGFFKGMIEDLDITGKLLSREAIGKLMAKRAARHCDLPMQRKADAKP